VSPELLALRPYWVIVAGVLGGLLGSFLNVCILRWGAEPKQSVVRPRSRCPRCGKSLAWYENIPVISWIALRARCSGCGLPISMQYPLIELATAAIWAYAAWIHGPSIEALREGVFGTILLGVAMTDAREYIIPHEFSLGGAAIALALSAWPDPANALSSLQGALVGAGAVLLIGELSELAVGQEAMGGGDCALMGMIGAFLGWEAILPVLLIGALISTMVYLIMALARRSKSTAVPSSEPVARPVGISNEVTPPSELGGFRWGLVARLFVAGLVPVLVLAAAVALHLIGPVLTALFHGLLGAGVGYYGAFLVPERMDGRWMRIRGLLAAALAIVVGSGLVWSRLVIGLVIGVFAIFSLKRTSIVLSPETTEGLESEGYLPFGVGLAIAAGIVLLSGALPVLREALVEYGRILRFA
jgi:leader peptidase (prepilin peptidase)/N-methyltransferase